jgi:hypothetical protein
MKKQEKRDVLYRFYTVLIDDARIEGVYQESDEDFEARKAKQKKRIK